MKDGFILAVSAHQGHHVVGIEVLEAAVVTTGDGAGLGHLVPVPVAAAGRSCIFVEQSIFKINLAETSYEIGR